MANTTNGELERLIFQTLQLLVSALQAIEDEAPTTRANAAKTLGLIGTETAIPALGQALEDDTPVVRQAAAEALKKIGTPSALGALQAKYPVSQPDSPTSDTDFDPITPLIGTLNLQTTDLAENHDHYLGGSHCPGSQDGCPTVRAIDHLRPMETAAIPVGQASCLPLMSAIGCHRLPSTSGLPPSISCLPLTTGFAIGKDRHETSGRGQLSQDSDKCIRRFEEIRSHCG
ncbi:MAG: HEAT repeat domain-containing protein [Cyanobacteria bacterium P01_D01_bin.14]